MTESTLQNPSRCLCSSRRSGGDHPKHCSYVLLCLFSQWSANSACRAVDLQRTRISIRIILTLRTHACARARLGGFDLQEGLEADFAFDCLCRFVRLELRGRSLLRVCQISCPSFCSLCAVTHLVWSVSCLLLTVAVVLSSSVALLHECMDGNFFVPSRFGRIRLVR